MRALARLVRTIGGTAALAAAIWATPATAVTAEARVKAAYLYKLASFVRWPDDAVRTGRFRFCLAGNRDVSLALDQLVRGERVLGMPASVDNVDAGQPAQVRSCHIVFAGRGREAGKALMDAAGGRPILTVADRNGGTSGGVVDFVIRDGKVRFVIDRSMARRQQLVLSSKLLDTAVSVAP